MTSGIKTSAIYAIPNLFMIFGGVGTPVGYGKHFDRSPTMLWRLLYV